MEEPNPEPMIHETIAHYKILEQIARGGMGEVYLALDLTLDRQVALKLLPQELQRDPSAQKRFFREAKAAAALDHPFIAHIHEVGEIKGKSFIAMEYVKGETLQSRLAQGPMPLETALQLGAEIAEALEEAAQKGIIHRDLKPSNIMITQAGHAKVMDFGLAKLLPPRDSSTPMESPITGLTQSGVRLGTMTYMSPEQLRGEVLDLRSDIFSFGILLYEMVTGVHPFKREDSIQTAGAILKEEPPHLLSSGSNSNQILSYILRKMLAKEKIRRYQRPREIQSDLLSLLNDIRAGEKSRGSALPARLWVKEHLRRILLASLIILLALAAVLPWLYREETVMMPFSTEILASPGERITHYYRHGFDISPDGTSLAVVSGQLQNPYIFPDRAQIFLRRFDQWNALPIAKTENAIQPFFSPDGFWIGFTQYDPESNQWYLKRVPRDGGEVITICNCEARWGAAWTADNSIILGNDTGGLLTVPAGGGIPQPLTQLEEGEVSHRLPQMLPDDTGVLFTSPLSGAALGTEARIHVYSFETGERKYLTDGWDARYASSGHLLLARDGVLYAAPFDLASLELEGEPVPIIEGITHALCTVSPTLRTGAAQFTVSDSGLLVYSDGSVFPEIKGSIVWVDADGKEQVVDVPPRNYFTVRLAPDTPEILTTAVYPPQEVWLYDLERKTHRRQTFEGNSLYAIWGPDAEHFTFTSDSNGALSLFTKRVDSGPGQIQPLLDSNVSFAARPSFWNEASRSLTLVAADPETGFDILVASEKGAIEPFLQTRFSEQYPEISPNGHWMVYTSNESGQQEVYVRSFSRPGRAIQISTQGGLEPAWARDGNSIYYRWRREFFKVRLSAEGSSLRPSHPEKLFEGDYGSAIAVRSYDVDANGRLILVKRPDATIISEAVDSFFSTRIRVVQNWLAELDRRIPGAR